MKRYAIFGNPVKHSISPLIHNAAFKGLKINAKYNKVLLEDGNRLKDKFYELGLSGANITVPHKEYAYAACDTLDQFAEQIGAVNTIVLKNTKLHGYNTDAPGFLKSIENYKNIIEKVLILGAGGTAKAISTILKLHGYDVSILNRSESRLEHFKKEGLKCYSFKNTDIQQNSYDLIINTTSAGLNNNELPAPKELIEKLIHNSSICIDVIYGKETSFLKLAKKYNKATKDGMEMLLHQGVIAFMYFTDEQYEYSLVESYMREAMNLHNPEKPSYYSLGERSFLRKSLILTTRDDIKRLGFYHKKVADQYDKIGVFYLEGGRRYNKSLLYFKSALNIREKIFGIDHIVLSTSYKNLAILYRLKGEYIKAEEYFIHALTLIKKHEKEDSSAIATINSQLGILYQEMGKLEESSLCINEASNLYQNDTYKKAIEYNNLASVKKSEGKYTEAIELYNKALVLQKKFKPVETPYTASIYNNLAYVYQKLRDFSAAYELYQKALIIRLDTIGERHEDTADTYYNLATILTDLKHYDKAEKYFLEAIEIRKNIYGKSKHPTIASLYESMGILSLLKSQNYHKNDKKKNVSIRQAKELFLKANIIRLDVQGDLHPDTASGYYTLGSYFYKYEHNLDEAFKYYSKALLMRQKIFKSGIHPDIASNYYHLSLIYLEKRECQNALEYVEKSIEITNELDYTHPLKHQFLAHLKLISSNIKKARKTPIKKRAKICIDL